MSFREKLLAVPWEGVEGGARVFRQAAMLGPKSAFSIPEGASCRQIRAALAMHTIPLEPEEEGDGMVVVPVGNVIPPHVRAGGHADIESGGGVLAEDVPPPDMDTIFQALSNWLRGLKLE